MSSSVLPLPASYKFGRVVCRVLQGVSDSPLDADRFPEAKPATGDITFTPTKTVIRDNGRSPAIVGHGAYKYTLHSESGELVDAQTENVPSELVDLGDGEFARLVPGAGVWLFEGVWNVKFNLGNISVPSFPIQVVAANNTVSTPMDLVNEMPHVEVPGDPTNLVALPLGKAPGNILGVSEAGELVWVVPTGGSGPTSWNTLIGKPEFVAEGHTASEARQSIDVPSVAEVQALMDTHINSTIPHQNAISGQNFSALFQNGLI